MPTEPSLHVVMYHYVRDLPRTGYPRLKGMLLDDFRKQLASLCGGFEMATLDSALAFLRGEYTPPRDMALLTFDDGLKEHYAEVMPLLAEAHVQGQFFLITSCLENGAVAPVHMNHFLMAKLDFPEYRDAFAEKLAAVKPGLVDTAIMEDRPIARATYPWDTAEVASFKYFFNFMLKPEARDQIVRALFEEHVGPEREFSRELYVSWEEARKMQSAGMLMGGHSHEHQPLAALERGQLEADLGACRSLLDWRLAPQCFWPFCFPYGKKSSFSAEAVAELRRLGFACAFSTESGVNAPGVEPFAIRRIDCKNALAPATAAHNA